MKKLFVSCPMKGRKEENIRKSIEKMHKIAEIVFDEELELIDSYLTEVPETRNCALWMLGHSLQKLSEADYFIGISSYSESNPGCMIEREAAYKYGLRTTLVDMRDIMPDWPEAECEYFHTATTAPTTKENTNET